MTELNSYLQTIRPELMSTARLFDIPDRAWEEPCRFSLCAREENGRYRISWTDGGVMAEGETEIPRESDPRLQELHRKRAARRLCKQILYDLCRKITGLHPAWGSLTGVRPTHLMLEALAGGMTPEAAVEHLVRDFDVTREKAELLSEIAAVQRKMPAPGDMWADVYIGIPFCTTRCAYCSFSSGEIGDGTLVEPYMEALEKEMRAGAELLRDAGKTLRAVYVGGGTPTALPQSALERLLGLMKEIFPGAAEYTVEAGRPDTLTAGKLHAIRLSGVHRISINPQTMNDRTLEVIGRGHTAQQIRDAYAMAREEGISHINMDVIAGLPGEGLPEFMHTMEEAQRLHPESLTVHTLAIKRSSRMKLENAPLPDGGMTSDMVRTGRETARKMNMRPYYLYKQKYMAGNQENTGYALPGHECLYNVDIMEETSHILAFGAGGISKRIFPEEGHIERAPNVYNIEQYICRTGEMIARKKALFAEK